jgi:hypothetical protein
MEGRPPCEPGGTVSTLIQPVAQSSFKPLTTPMPQPELRHYVSSFIVATVKAGTVQFVGRLAFDLPRQAEDEARERGERLGLPVRKLGAVDPRKVTGPDCVVVLERRVMNGSVEVYDE